MADIAKQFLPDKVQAPGSEVWDDVRYDPRGEASKRASVLCTGGGVNKELLGTLFSSLFRRIFKEYGAGAEIRIERQIYTESDIDELLAKWCTNRKIRGRINTAILNRGVLMMSDSMMSIHLDERPRGYWVFCQDASCRRCYLTGEERIRDGHPWCAYPDCDGGDIMDAVSWERMRTYHSELPKVPERGVRYLYNWDA